MDPAPGGRNGLCHSGGVVFPVGDAVGGKRYGDTLYGRLCLSSRGGEYPLILAPPVGITRRVGRGGNSPESSVYAGSVISGIFSAVAVGFSIGA